MFPAECFHTCITYTCITSSGIFNSRLLCRMSLTFTWWSTTFYTPYNSHSHCFTNTYGAVLLLVAQHVAVFAAAAAHLLSLVLLLVNVIVVVAAITVVVCASVCVLGPTSTCWCWCWWCCCCSRSVETSGTTRWWWRNRCRWCCCCHRIIIDACSSCGSLSLCVITG